MEAPALRQDLGVWWNGRFGKVLDVLLPGVWSTGCCVFWGIAAGPECFEGTQSR